jgi:hypothetical protein
MFLVAVSGETHAPKSGATEYGIERIAGTT